jgi:hypothetical protein
MPLFPLLWLGFLSFSSSALALDFSPGFYSLESTEIPPSVRARATSIFRLEIPYFTEVRREAYAVLLDTPAIPEAGRADLRYCQEKNSSICWIHFAEERGTAFLDENGQAAWTNCHLVSTWIQYRKHRLLLDGVAEAQLWEALRASPLPLQLRDAQGRVRVRADEKTFLSAAVIQGLKSGGDLRCSLQDDAVRIRLPKVLGPGLPRAKDDPTHGAPLFLGGFPRPTESRAAGFNADGESFAWVKGPSLAREQYNAYFGTGHRYGFVFSNPSVQAVLSDGAQGMSGGPILNEEGAVVGIYKGFLDRKDGGDLPLVSLYLSVRGLRFVEIYSESLFPGP